MRGPELAHLQAFLEVARQGNFGRAAKALKMSFSTLSETIKHLEERLGMRLFNRTTRSVALTGRPTSPFDLKKHRCINWKQKGHGVYRWEFFVDRSDSGSKGRFVRISRLTALSFCSKNSARHYCRRRAASLEHVLRGGEVRSGRSPAGIADYRNTVHASAAYLDGIAGKQAGDPERAARAILDFVASEHPPVHVLLGSDALRRARVYRPALGRHQEAAPTWSRAAALTPTSRFMRLSTAALETLETNETDPYRSPR